MSSVLKRTNEKTIIARIHINSPWAKEHLSTCLDGEFIVLQVLPAGNDWLIVEYIKRSDYDLQNSTHL